MIQIDQKSRFGRWKKCLMEMEQDQMEQVQWLGEVRDIAQEMKALALQEECQEAEDDMAVMAEDLEEAADMEEDMEAALEEDYSALPEELEEAFLATGDQHMGKHMQNQHMNNMQNQQKKSKPEFLKKKLKLLQQNKKL